jgi:hypothetical protein
MRPELRIQFFPAAVIAIAAGVSSLQVRRRAARERWARRVNGNAHHFIPPRPILARCRQLLRRGKPRGLQVAPLTPERRAESLRLAHRMFACLMLASALDTGCATELALIRVAHLVSFNCSATSLRRWFQRFEKHGVSGLAENKLGRVGRKKGKR